MCELFLQHRSTFGTEFTSAVVSAMWADFCAFGDFLLLGWGRRLWLSGDYRVGWMTIIIHIRHHSYGKRVYSLGVGFFFYKCGVRDTFVQKSYIFLCNVAVAALMGCAKVYPPVYVAVATYACVVEI